MGGYAWVTLATNDSYSLGALVLAHSLRKVGTSHQLAVLITPAVSEGMRGQLQTVFDLVKVVDVLDSKDETNLALLKRPELGITFTKIHCWRLTEYEKCVFLDADTLVVRNCDELFERDELSAAPDVGWPDCFNTGVFVFKPSDETFNQLVKFAVDQGSFDGGDQGLLNMFFSNWASQDIKKHLPFVYNLTSVAVYSYIPAFKHYGSEIRIVHFIGAIKPWLQQIDPSTRTVNPSPGSEHLTGLLQSWWDLFIEKVHPSLSKDVECASGIMNLQIAAYPDTSNVDNFPGTTPEPDYLLDANYDFTPFTPYIEKDDSRQINLPYLPFDVKSSSGELLNVSFLLARENELFEDEKEQEQDQQQQLPEEQPKGEEINVAPETDNKEGQENSNVENNDNGFIPETKVPEFEAEEQHREIQQEMHEEYKKSPFDYYSFFPDETCINTYLEQNALFYQPFEGYNKSYEPNLGSNENPFSGQGSDDNPSLPRFLTIPEDDQRQSSNAIYNNNNNNNEWSQPEQHEQKHHFDHYYDQNYPHHHAPHQEERQDLHHHHHHQAENHQHHHFNEGEHWHQHSNESQPQQEHHHHYHHHSPPQQQEHQQQQHQGSHHPHFQPYESSQNGPKYDERIYHHITDRPETAELIKSKSMSNLSSENNNATMQGSSFWKSQPNVNDASKKYSMPKLKPLLPKQTSSYSPPEDSRPKVTQYTEFHMSSEYKDPVNLPGDKVGFVEREILKESSLKPSKSETNMHQKFGALHYSVEPDPDPYLNPQEHTSQIAKDVSPIKQIEISEELDYDLSLCKRQSGNKPLPKDDKSPRRLLKKESIISLPVLKPLVPPDDDAKEESKTAEYDGRFAKPEDKERIRRQKKETRRGRERKREQKKAKESETTKSTEPISYMHTNNVTEILSRLAKYSKEYQNYLKEPLDANKEATDTPPKNVNGRKSPSPKIQINGHDLVTYQTYSPESPNITTPRIFDSDTVLDGFRQNEEPDLKGVARHGTVMTEIKLKAEEVTARLNDNAPVDTNEKVKKASGIPKSNSTSKTNSPERLGDVRTESSAITAENKKQKETPKEDKGTQFQYFRSYVKGQTENSQKGLLGIEDIAPEPEGRNREKTSQGLKSLPTSGVLSHASISPKATPIMRNGRFSKIKESISPKENKKGTKTLFGNKEPAFKVSEPKELVKESEMKVQSNETESNIYGKEPITTLGNIEDEGSEATTSKLSTKINILEDFSIPTKKVSTTEATKSDADGELNNKENAEDKPIQSVVSTVEVDDDDDDVLTKVEASLAEILLKEEEITKEKQNEKIEETELKISEVLTKIDEPLQKEEVRERVDIIQSKKETMLSTLDKVEDIVHSNQHELTQKPQRSEFLPEVDEDFNGRNVSELTNIKERGEQSSLVFAEKVENISEETEVKKQDPSSDEVNAQKITESLHALMLESESKQTPTTSSNALHNISSYASVAQKGGPFSSSSTFYQPSFPSTSTSEPRRKLSTKTFGNKFRKPRQNQEKTITNKESENKTEDIPAVASKKRTRKPDEKSRENQAKKPANIFELLPEVSPDKSSVKTSHSKSSSNRSSKRKITPKSVTKTGKSLLSPPAANSSTSRVNTSSKEPSRTYPEAPVLDTNDNSGIAGAIAQLNLESASSTSDTASSATSAQDEYLRRQKWETGNMDYMGRDSFDNIWSKIQETIDGKVPEESDLQVEETRSDTETPKPVSNTSTQSVSAEDTSEDDALLFASLNKTYTPVSLSMILDPRPSDPDCIDTLPFDTQQYIVEDEEDDTIIFCKAVDRLPLLSNIIEEEGPLIESEIPIGGGDIIEVVEVDISSTSSAQNQIFGVAPIEEVLPTSIAEEEEVAPSKISNENLPDVIMAESQGGALIQVSSIEESQFVTLVAPASEGNDLLQTKSILDETQDDSELKLEKNLKSNVEETVFDDQNLEINQFPTLGSIAAQVEQQVETSKVELISESADTIKDVDDDPNVIPQAVAIASSVLLEPEEDFQDVSLPPSISESLLQDIIDAQEAVFGLARANNDEPQVGTDLTKVVPDAPKADEVKTTRDPLEVMVDLTEPVIDIIKTVAHHREPNTTNLTELVTVLPKVEDGLTGCQTDTPQFLADVSTAASDFTELLNDVPKTISDSFEITEKVLTDISESVVDVLKPTSEVTETVNEEQPQQPVGEVPEDVEKVLTNLSETVISTLQSETDASKALIALVNEASKTIADLQESAIDTSKTVDVLVEAVSEGLVNLEETVAGVSKTEVSEIITEAHQSAADPSETAASVSSDLGNIAKQSSPSEVDAQKEVPELTKLTTDLSESVQNTLTDLAEAVPKCLTELAEAAVDVTNPIANFTESITDALLISLPAQPTQIYSDLPQPEHDTAKVSNELLPSVVPEEDRSQPTLESLETQSFDLKKTEINHDLEDQAIGNKLSKVSEVVDINPNSQELVKSPSEAKSVSESLGSNPHPLKAPEELIGPSKQSESIASHSNPRNPSETSRHSPTSSSKQAKDEGKQKKGVITKILEFVGVSPKQKKSKDETGEGSKSVFYDSEIKKLQDYKPIEPIEPIEHIEQVKPPAVKELSAPRASPTLIETCFVSTSVPSEPPSAEDAKESSSLPRTGETIDEILKATDLRSIPDEPVKDDTSGDDVVKELIQIADEVEASLEATIKDKIEEATGIAKELAEELISTEDERSAQALEMLSREDELEGILEPVTGKLVLLSDKIISTNSEVRDSIADHSEGENVLETPVIDVVEAAGELSDEDQLKISQVVAETFEKILSVLEDASNIVDESKEEFIKPETTEVSQLQPVDSNEKSPCPESRQKSPSPLIFVKESQSVPETQIISPTPPTSPGCKPLLSQQDLKALSIDETIPETPPIGEAEETEPLEGEKKTPIFHENNLACESEEILSEKESLLSEIDSIIERAKVYVESQLPTDCLLGDILEKSCDKTNGSDETKRTKENELDRTENKESREAKPLVPAKKSSVSFKPLEEEEVARNVSEEDLEEEEEDQDEEPIYSNVQKVDSKLIVAKPPEPINPFEEVEEIKVTSDEERRKHKSQPTKSKLSGQILKAIPPPRRKAISDAKVKAETTGAISRSKTESPSEGLVESLSSTEVSEASPPPPVPPRRNRSKQRQPPLPPPKRKTKK